jgi:hydrogenase maturation factor HypF (carbamoyltransferase family)
MAHESANTQFEKERVKVTRVKTGQRGQAEPSVRHDRLIIYLQDGNVVRTEDGKKEELRRKAGEVVWRPRSQHQIEHQDGHHEVLIVELKS